MTESQFSALEICAGAGGQALGLELAGFGHAAAAEIDRDACATLRMNRPSWNVLETDIRELNGRDFRGLDLFAGGVPCPPFSVAGRQLGSSDERDLFPVALQIVEDSEPSAVMLENVPGLATAKFSVYRREVAARLTRLGYRVDWRVLNACDYRVPQLRPRFIFVAIKSKWAAKFEWPAAIGTPPTVGEALHDLMATRGWRGASGWAEKAKSIAPTLVGGSKKHGGPDLGPTRARAAWLELGIEGRSLAELAPDAQFPIAGVPRLTVRMAARIQGFPDSWKFEGRKTAAYRQVGNAFPPPVAFAVAGAIRSALEGRAIGREREQHLLALHG